MTQSVDSLALCRKCDRLCRNTVAGVPFQYMITFMIDHPNIPGEPTFKGTLDGTGKKRSVEFTQGGAAGTFAVEKQ